jgi:hypothetical protein
MYPERWLRCRTLWANLCCWRLKLRALDFKAEVRARAVNALCIVKELVVYVDLISQVLHPDSSLLQDDKEEMKI